MSPRLTPAPEDVARFTPGLAGTASAPAMKARIISRASRRAACIWLRLPPLVPGHPALDRTVRFATEHYGVVIASAVALILVAFGLVGGRYLSFSFLPLQI